MRRQLIAGAAGRKSLDGGDPSPHDLFALPQVGLIRVGGSDAAVGFENVSLARVDACDVTTHRGLQFWRQTREHRGRITFPGCQKNLQTSLLLGDDGAFVADSWITGWAAARPQASVAASDARAASAIGRLFRVLACFIVLPFNEVAATV